MIDHSRLLKKIPPKLVVGEGLTPMSGTTARQVVARHWTVLNLA